MNIINRRVDWFSFTYLSSRDWLIICQFNRLFREIMSFEMISIDWATRNRSNDASDWHIDARYVSRVLSAIYCFLMISIFLILSRALVMIVNSIELINCMFWICDSCLKWIMSFESIRSILMSLNFKKCSKFNCSRVLIIILTNLSLRSRQQRMIDQQECEYRLFAYSLCLYRYNWWRWCIADTNRK
jgi:hypothetical protein